MVDGFNLFKLKTSDGDNAEYSSTKTRLMGVLSSSVSRATDGGLGQRSGTLSKD
jgi:hypothetical protein